MARSPRAPGRKSSGGSGTETDPYLTAGPEDEFEPDWGAGPGAAGLEFPTGTRRNPRTVAPWSSGTGRMHGARLGMDIGGRCGFRPAAEDKMAMMTGSLGDTHAHHHQPGRRFRHRGEAQGFRGGPRNSWRGPGFSRAPCIMPAAGSPNPVGHHRAAVALSDLGEVCC